MGQEHEAREVRRLQGGLERRPQQDLQEGVPAPLLQVLQGVRDPLCAGQQDEEHRDQAVALEVYLPLPAGIEGPGRVQLLQEDRSVILKHDYRKILRESDHGSVLGFEGVYELYAVPYRALHAVLDLAVVLRTRLFKQFLRGLLEEGLAVGCLGVDLAIDEVGILVLSFQEEHELLAVFVLFRQLAVLFDLRVAGLGERVPRGNAGTEGLGLRLDFQLGCEVRRRCVRFGRNYW